MSSIQTTPKLAGVQGIDTPLQVLAPDGTRKSCDLLDPWLTDVDTEFAIQLYTDMRVTRRFDEEAFALTRQGQLGLWAPLEGQEASQVGSFHALNPQDWVFGSYREHTAALLRGADTTQWLKTWKAHDYASWNPHELHVANFQIIIGAQTLHAVGYAMGAQYLGLDSLAITYFGDGATSAGDVSEALVFASTYRAPVVFFCQNNGFAISEPVEVQAKHPLAQRALGFDIPAIRVDGNDVFAVLAATRIACERARAGDGPTFIEAVTYRMGPHTTTDDPTRYRSPEDEKEWRHKDPITRVEHYLAQLGDVPTGLHDRITQQCSDFAMRLREGITDLPAEDPSMMFNHVLTTPSARIQQQHRQHQALVASLDTTGGEHS